MVMRRGDGDDVKDKILKKNKELSELLDELKVTTAQYIWTLAIIRPESQRHH